MVSLIVKEKKGKGTAGDVTAVLSLGFDLSGGLHFGPLPYTPLIDNGRSHKPGRKGPYTDTGDKREREIVEHLPAE